MRNRLKTAPGKAVDTAMWLEAMYETYNRRDYVSPDPLQFLYDFPEVRDREITAMIASALAYGRVGQIVQSVGRVLAPMRPSPRAFIESNSAASLRRTFRGFKHRFTTDEDVVRLLVGVKQAVRRFGSLEACLAQCLEPGALTVVEGLGRFVACLRIGVRAPGHVLPTPRNGSACKRLNLFLRWMVRRDAVDPGGWECVKPSQLLVPLDTHMHRMSLALGLTARKQANMATALEVSAGFRAFAPEDPARYDFALTRLGMLGTLGHQELPVPFDKSGLSGQSDEASLSRMKGTTNERLGW